ncbi:MAG: pilus assembly protein CpaE, partial [Alcaligenaceae bacterium]|nr:pilus assembly protein CpaE [Alcaligenaceae bacterium]
MSAVGAFSGKSKDAARNAGLVAFASDDTTARDLLQFFEQLGESDVYVGRGGIDAVIDHLGRVETSPKRLVVDISGIDQPLAALDRLADACDPSVQVYVLGDKNDVTLYRALLQAGVRDYRYKPMTAEALRSWVDDQDGSLVRRSRTGKIIAVTGTRGGVGTTTVATRLAAQLTEG